MRSPLGRSWARPTVAATIGATVILMATPAWAHLEPEPGEAPTGTRVKIDFVVEHGCGASPTTALDMQLPAGITDVSIPAKTGWKTSLTKTEAKWSGGQLPSDQTEGFTLEFVTPGQPGPVPFKVVQSCVEGELAWIQTQEPGGEEPELPIPTLQVTGPVVTTTTMPAATTTTAATGATAITGESTIPVDHTSDRDLSDKTSTSKRSTNALAVWIGVAVALAVLVAVVAMLRQPRNRGSDA